MSGRLRVAFVLTQDSGGPVDVTVRLARALIAGGEVDVRVFGPVPRRGAEVVRGHHEVVEVGDKADVVAGRRARAVVRAWRPDVVHAQDRRAGLVTAALRWRHKVIQTYHGVPDDVGEPWFRGVRGAAGPSLYTRTVLAADAVVARTVHRTVVPAQAMGRFLASRLKVPVGRLAHIDNCVEPAHVHPPVGPVRRLVFVGLLVERKGLVTLLEALALPGVMPADATLTVVGDGPERVRAEALARALGGRVEFLGFRADVPDLLRHHDALVLPSTMEQQPLVVAEAMAAGKPVVATDTGGVADMLGEVGSGGLESGEPAVGHAGSGQAGSGQAAVGQVGSGRAGSAQAGSGHAGPGHAGSAAMGSGHAGFAGPGSGGALVAPGDVEGLAARLRALFAEPDPGRIGLALAERAQERFAPDVCARRHLALYRDVMGLADPNA